MSDRCALSVAAAVGCLLVISLFRMSHAADWPPVAGDPATARIEESLGEATTLQFIETPLQDVVDYLEDLHGIEIQIDQRVLEDQGIGTDTPITRNLKGITLRSALRLMLRELKLTYFVWDEVLLITTPEASEKHVYVQAYDVEPLTAKGATAEGLAGAVRDVLGRDKTMPPADAAKITRPDGDKPREKSKKASAKKQRGIAVFQHFLLVTDSYHGHQKVRRLLGTLAHGLNVKPVAGKDSED